MENSNLTHSNRWRLAVMLSMSVTLATLLLGLFLPTIQTSEVPAIAPLANYRGITSLSSSSVITIGVGADLSGPGADMGWQELNSVQLAINQVNAEGGIKIGRTTYSLALVSADSAGDPTQAITAANTLLSAGAVAIVGHSWSGECLAAQPIYNAAGVAMVSPSCTRPIVTQQGYNTTFRTIPHDGTPGTLLAKHLRALGLPTSAIVESGYLEPGDFYASTFTALGGIITGRHVVNDPSEFMAVLTAIQTENPDAIAVFTIFGYGDPVQQGEIYGEFSRTAHSLGMTNVVIAWSAFTNDETALLTYADAAGAAAAKGDFAAMEWRRFTDMPGWTTFLADYQAVGFPNEPDDPGVFGTFAYDAARIIIDAIERANSTDPTAIRKKIATTKNHEGVVGRYWGFDANGDVIPQWAWLEQYQGWVTVKMKQR